MSREYQDYCNTNYTEADIPEPEWPSDGEIYAFVSKLGMTEAEIAEINAAIEQALCNLGRCPDCPSRAQNGG